MTAATLARERRFALPGRRVLALAVVLAVHAVLVVLFFTLAPEQTRRPAAAPGPKMFQLAPSPEPQPTPKPAPAKRKARGAPPRPRAKPAEKPGAAAARAEAAKAAEAAQQPFGTELFEAIDIAKLPNVRNELPPGGGAADPGTANDSEVVSGPGGGPNGEQLYAAEWQREPTDAELSFYLPKTGVPQDSWAVVACKTVARYRVEDCRELGDSPPGSGLARAITNAAWQFRVLPPRVGGRALVGSWVRIRIDFSRGEAK